MICRLKYGDSCRLNISLLLFYMEFDLNAIIFAITFCTTYKFINGIWRVGLGSNVETNLSKNSC